MHALPVLMNSKELGIIDAIVWIFGGKRIVSLHLRHRNVSGKTLLNFLFMKRTSKSGIRCFTKWSRKGYGAFASLGKTVKIGVLALSMSIITLNPKSASAQSDTLRVMNEMRIEALEVTGERLNPTRGVVTPTEVYSRDTLSVAPLQTIESVLRLNPALDIRERGGKGVQADISLRGGTYDQTMILLNGIDFTDARTGHQSHSLPVDLDIVGKIDIISGQTGIGAYAGAVNILTTPLRPSYLRTEITGGAYGYLYSNISGAVMRGNLSVLAAGSVRRSDGYIANTDFNNTNLFTRITYHGSRTGLFDVQAGYQRRDFGSNGFYSLAYPDQFEHTETTLASARWNRSFGHFTVSAQASYRKNNDRYELFRGGKNAPAGWKPNYHTTDNAGAEISGAYRWAAGITSLGIDYKYNHIYSNVLGEPMVRPIGVPGADAQYTREQDRNIFNGWLNHSVRLGGTSLAGSVNLAASPYGTFPSWSISVKHRLTTHWSADADATRSMRLPTFTDLYYSNATHIGNPDLKPEHAVTYRLGTFYSQDCFTAAATGYYRHGTDIIDWAQTETPDGLKWKSTQLTKLDTYGIELQVSYRGQRTLRNVTLSYGWMSSDKNAPDYISKYALDYMKHKLALQAGVNIWKGFVAEATLAWYDRNQASDMGYTPYLLLDARLSWTGGAFTVYLEATNLLDTAYYDFIGLRQPPRWISGGIVFII